MKKWSTPAISELGIEMTAKPGPGGPGGPGHPGGPAGPGHPGHSGGPAGSGRPTPPGSVEPPIIVDPIIPGGDDDIFDSLS